MAGGEGLMDGRVVRLVMLHLCPLFLDVRIIKTALFEIGKTLKVSFCLLMS
jgi:hypothetical protein